MLEYLVDDLRKMLATTFSAQRLRFQRWVQDWRVLRLRLTEGAVKYYGATQRDWFLILAEELTKRFPPNEIDNS